MEKIFSAQSAHGHILLTHSAEIHSQKNIYHLSCACCQSKDMADEKKQDKVLK